MKPTTAKKNFGKHIRALREARGWSQEELAARSKKHWTYIGGIERGERNPTMVVIVDLAKALKVSPSELFDWVISKLPSPINLVNGLPGIRAYCHYRRGAILIPM